MRTETANGALEPSANDSLLVPFWSFLGPAGTFTEMALRQVAPVNVELDPCPDVPTALDHLTRDTLVSWGL